MDNPKHITPILRIFVVEDDERRLDKFKEWAQDRPQYDLRFVWARSVGKALGILSRTNPQDFAGIMLDHDLGTNAVIAIDQAYNGRDVVRAVLEQICPSTPVFVHSANERFAPEMAATLTASNFLVDQIPMPRLSKHRFCEWLDDLWETYESR